MLKRLVGIALTKANSSLSIILLCMLGFLACIAGTVRHNEAQAQYAPLSQVEATQLILKVANADKEALGGLLTKDFVLTNNGGDRKKATEVIATRTEVARTFQTSKVWGLTLQQPCADAFVATFFSQADPKVLNQPSWLLAHTHMYIKQDGKWKLAAAHMSPVTHQQ
jgi:hypothetical protein